MAKEYPSKDPEIEYVGQIVPLVEGGISRINVMGGWVIITHKAPHQMLFIEDNYHEWKLET